MSGVSGYQTVDVLGYNPTTKKLGLKVNGADTVIPFSGGFTPQYVNGNGAYNGGFNLDHNTDTIYVGQSYKGTFQLYVNGSNKALTDICNYGPSSGGGYGLHIAKATGEFKTGDRIAAHSLGAASEYGIWIMG